MENCIVKKIQIDSFGIIEKLVQHFGNRLNDCYSFQGIRGELTRRGWGPPAVISPKPADIAIELNKPKNDT